MEDGESMRSQSVLNLVVEEHRKKKRLAITHLLDKVETIAPAILMTFVMDKHQ